MEGNMDRFTPKFIRFNASGTDSVLPTLLYIGADEVASPRYSWDAARHNHTEKTVFQYTLSGRGCLEHEGRLHDVSAGKAFILNINASGSRYFYPQGEKSPWRFVFCVFKNLMEEVEEINGRHGPVYEFDIRSPIVRRLMSLLETGQGREAMSRPSQNAGFCSEILVEMCRQMERTRDGKEAALVHLVRKLIYEMRLRRFSLEEIAAKANVSREHVCHALKRNLGMTPGQLHAQMQLEEICARLADQGTSLKKIAFDFGFADVSYFCKHFRRHVGITPGQFRRSRSLVLHELTM
jgi:AraC-like DNA-binding protein